MIVLSQRHPLVLALLTILLGGLVFPFGMYGYQYIAAFVAIAVLWLVLVVMCFRKDPWKGTVAIFTPFVLMVPYFLAGFWMSCRYGIFGGCL
jgi:hypothetical protein